MGDSSTLRNCTAHGNSTKFLVEMGNDLGTIQTSPLGAGAWDNFEF